MSDGKEYLTIILKLLSKIRVAKTVFSDECRCKECGAVNTEFHREDAASLIFGS
jgi:hypothetical protein